MQGAGARAESGGESAMMDQLTAVLRKNRKLQRRLHALMGAGFDREALLPTGFVDRPCPKGHQLIAVTGQPYVSGWFCVTCAVSVFLVTQVIFCIVQLANSTFVADVRREIGAAPKGMLSCVSTENHRTIQVGAVMAAKK